MVLFRGGGWVAARSPAGGCLGAPVLVLEVLDRPGGAPTSSGCDLDSSLALVDALAPGVACEVRDGSTLDRAELEPRLPYRPEVARLDPHLYGEAHLLHLRGEDAQRIARVVAGAVASRAWSLAACSDALEWGAW